MSHPTYSSSGTFGRWLPWHWNETKLVTDDHLQDRLYRQNHQTRSFHFYKEYGQSIKNVVATEM